MPPKARGGFAPTSSNSTSAPPAARNAFPSLSSLTSQCQDQQQSKVTPSAASSSAPPPPPMESNSQNQPQTQQSQTQKPQAQQAFTKCAICHRDNVALFRDPTNKQIYCRDCWFDYYAEFPSEKTDRFWGKKSCSRYSLSSVEPKWRDVAAQYDQYPPAASCGGSRPLVSACTGQQRDSCIQNKNHRYHSSSSSSSSSAAAATTTNGQTGHSYMSEYYLKRHQDLIHYINEETGEYVPFVPISSPGIAEIDSYFGFDDYQKLCSDIAAAWDTITAHNKSKNNNNHGGRKKQKDEASSSSAPSSQPQLSSVDEQRQRRELLDLFVRQQEQQQQTTSTPTTTLGELEVEPEASENMMRMNKFGGLVIAFKRQLLDAPNSRLASSSNSKRMHNNNNNKNGKNNKEDDDDDHDDHDEQKQQGQEQQPQNQNKNKNKNTNNQSSKNLTPPGMIPQSAAHGNDDDFYSRYYRENIQQKFFYNEEYQMYYYYDDEKQQPQWYYGEETAEMIAQRSANSNRKINDDNNNNNNDNEEAAAATATAAAKPKEGRETDAASDNKAGPKQKHQHDHQQQQEQAEDHLPAPSSSSSSSSSCPSIYPRIHQDTGVEYSVLLKRYDDKARKWQFCNVQLVEVDVACYVCYERKGYLNQRGLIDSSFHTVLASCRQAFHSKFHGKTKNDWTKVGCNALNFEYYEGFNFLSLLDVEALRRVVKEKQAKHNSRLQVQQQAKVAEPVVKKQDVSLPSSRPLPPAPSPPLVPQQNQNQNQNQQQQPKTSRSVSAQQVQSQPKREQEQQVLKEESPSNIVATTEQIISNVEQPTTTVKRNEQRDASSSDDTEGDDDDDHGEGGGGDDEEGKIKTASATDLPVGSGPPQHDGALTTNPSNDQQQTQEQAPKKKKKKKNKNKNKKKHLTEAEIAEIQRQERKAKKKEEAARRQNMFMAGMAVCGVAVAGLIWFLKNRSKSHR